MKQLLTILCLTLVSSYSYSHEVSTDKCYQYTDGICYEPNSRKPFTGTYTHYYENGQLERTGNVEDGKEEGVWEFFNENGQLERRGNYKEGEQDGVWEYFDEDGKLIE